MTALDQNYYTEMYQPALFRMIEATQLIPASASYHHTAPGGLITHTVAVIEYALEERTRHILPELSDVETQAREKHIWTYAVFAAAVLHDAGKLLTQQSLLLSDTDKTTFSPFIEIKTLPQDLNYKLQFKQLADSYRIHKQVAATFFGFFIPPTAQTWLSQSMHVFDELTAFIQGIDQHSGSIGRIIRYADSRSVAENLGLAKSTRFLGATPPLSEKIIVAIRQVIPLLGVNKPGASVYKKGDTAWIVSKILADAVKEWLQKHGESVPHDNNRIFDELENFGYALVGQKGIVQWIRVKMVGFDQRLSVIGFDIRRIYHGSNLPKDIMGEIILDTEMRANPTTTDTATRHTTVAASDNFESETASNSRPDQYTDTKSNQSWAEGTHAGTETIQTETGSDPKVHTAGTELPTQKHTGTGRVPRNTIQMPGMAPIEDIWGLPPIQQTDTESNTTEHTGTEWGYDNSIQTDTEDSTGYMLPQKDSPQITGWGEPHTETENNQVHTETGWSYPSQDVKQLDVPKSTIQTETGADMTKTKTFIPFDPSLLPPLPDCPLLSKEMGDFFVHWLKVMIKHRRFEINENDSPVHKVAAHLIGLMTPKIFMLFCQDYNLMIEGTNGPANQVRNSVKKAEYLVSHATAKKEIFKCQVVGQVYELYFCLIHEKYLIEYGVSIPINQTIILKDVPKST